jgi:transposase
MGVAYSQDLRDRVLGARERGIKTKAVADLFNVSASWVRRVVQRRRDNNEAGPRPRGGVTVVKIDMERLRQLAWERPDATTRELHGRLGIQCSQSAVDAALKRLGLSFKKRRSTPRSRTGPTWPCGGRNGRPINPRVTPGG